MNELAVFSNPEFGEIRTVEEDGTVLFCGSDIAKALGYASPANAVTRFCKGVTVLMTPSAGGSQQTKFIPEGDMYRLIVHSKLPSAERFERWVFDEVLPSIRQHGAYMTPKTLEAVLLSPDTIIRLATDLKKEQEQRRRLEEENAQQRKQIADFQPIRQYVDTILASDGTLAISQIAADYNITATRLNRILAEEGVQHKVHGQWILYRQHMGKGYTKSATIAITRSDGRQDTILHTQWTQKGRLMIHELLTQRGIKAAMDMVL